MDNCDWFLDSTLVDCPKANGASTSHLTRLISSHHWSSKVLANGFVILPLSAALATWRKWCVIGKDSKPCSQIPSSLSIWGRSALIGRDGWNYPETTQSFLPQAKPLTREDAKSEGRYTVPPQSFPLAKWREWGGSWECGLRASGFLQRVFPHPQNGSTCQGFVRRK